MAVLEVWSELLGLDHAMIELVTFVACAEPDVKWERMLRESDRVPTVASPLLFPKDSFHLLCFFVTVGDTGTG